MESEHENNELSISGPSSDRQPDDLSSAPQIEGYEISDRLGEGGMGAVWRAVQLSTRRQVALKFRSITAFGSEKARARFEREVELTARFQHPNIARIYDSGLQQGVCYYAMELVEGLPLDKYVEEQRLTRREILELMQTVCDAVQHAQQRGVIHRDLKPSNILVTADGQPHILDFGLAKSLLEGDSDLSLSAEGVPAGTPAYMSPEQAAGRREQIDTRTDVYSLGVILFRLVTGNSPHDLAGSIYDVLHRIGKQDVQRPREVSKEVDRELEALLLKALARDPKDRYPSAGALAQDIDNYLVGEPLTARPPTTSYFLRKRIRKYRVPVAIACSVVAALVGMAVYAYVRVVQERDKTAQARDDAQKEADTAVAVYDFLEGILTSVDPEKAQGREISLREALDNAAEDVSTELADQPEVEAKVRMTIGETYDALGLYDAAEPHFSRALEVRRRVLGEEHPDTLMVMDRVGNVFLDQGKLDEAEEKHRRNLEVRRRVLGEEHSDTLWSMNNLASTLGQKRLFDEAEALHRRVLEVRLRVLGEEHIDTLTSMNNLAVLLFHMHKWQREKLDEAVSLHRRALEVRRRILGEEHPDTLRSQQNLAVALDAAGKSDEAETMLKDLLETLRRVLGEEHPHTLMTMNNLAHVLRNREKLEESEAIQRQSLEIARRVQGEEHRTTFLMMRNLAGILKKRGKLDEAVTMQTQLLETQHRVLGEEDLSTLQTMMALIPILELRGKLEEADAMRKRLIEARLRGWREDHPDTLHMMRRLAYNLRTRGKLEEAETTFGRILSIRRKGKEQPHTLMAMKDVAITLFKKGRLEEAEAMLREGLSTSRRDLGDEQPVTTHLMAYLACMLEETGRPNEAEPLRRESAEIQRRLFDRKHGAPPPPSGPMTAPTESTPTPAPVAYDGFDGKLTLDWKILNPDPSHYSFSKAPGMLTITTQDGGFANSATDYENLFLIDCPAAEASDFQLTTCLSSFRPAGNWNQAGLIFYNDDDDYLKFVYESNAGAVGRVFAVGSETKGAFSEVYFPAYERVEKVWLRVAKRGNRYAFSTSLDGKSFIGQEYTVGDHTGRFRDDLTWGDGSVKQVGIFAKNGPNSTAPEVDASFDFFEVRSLSGEAGEADEGVSSHEEEANVEARP